MLDKGRSRPSPGNSLALAAALAELVEAAGIGLRLFRGWRPPGMEAPPETPEDRNHYEAGRSE